MTKHPLYGDNVIGSQVCSPTVTDNDINDGSDDDGGADDWRFQPEDGTVRRSNNRHLCMAYYTTAPPSTAGTSSTQFNQMVLRAVNCSAASPSHSTASSSRTPSPPLPRQQQSTRFSIISSGSLPEGGSSMLKAIDMDNKTSPCGSGCSSRFVADGGCVSMVRYTIHVHSHTHTHAHVHAHPNVCVCEKNHVTIKTKSQKQKQKYDM